MKKFVLFLLYFHFVFSSKCPSGSFLLPFMSTCHRYLDCNDIKSVRIVKELNSGFVKTVYLAKWKHYNIVLMKPNRFGFDEDFETGLSMLKMMSPNDHVTQLIGYCEERNIILTEYHMNGDARNLLALMEKNSSIDTIENRLKLCINYAEILQMLHSGPYGTRVACDSNSLDKLLSQFLVTSDLKLIVNDVDALPQVQANASILCGSRRLAGDFVAPEQKSTSVIGYNEKTDIWKAASVCQYFIEGHKDSQIVLYSIYELHKQCKSSDPKQRPTADELVDGYKRVLYDLIASRSEL
ncbi:hypothetical protein LSTR_LSTR003585 [Laodelphax striatellus]|uniref:Protein O-mannose kinase n=1 Tax=Laodelphax striatellus TaxID=195883 RepID=A0A482WKW1_LAOST|nr:hypothetical protein LSTR_LSTR003585 [Laodelphax striatellus]